MLAWAHGTAGRYGEAAQAAERAIEHADLAGDERQHARAATLYALSALLGPTPVSEAIDRCRRIVDDAPETGARRASSRASSAGSRRCAATSTPPARSPSGAGRSSSTSEQACAPRHRSRRRSRCSPASRPSAERDLRRDYEALTAIGETYLRSTVAGDLAQAVYVQGRYDEALELSRVAEELAAEDDVTSQAFWRSVRAKVLARRDRLEEAVPLAEAGGRAAPADGRARHARPSARRPGRGADASATVPEDARRRARGGRAPARAQGERRRRPRGAASARGARRHGDARLTAQPGAASRGEAAPGSAVLLDDEVAVPVEVVGLVCVDGMKIRSFVQSGHPT